jgi:hypothetical protein
MNDREAEAASAPGRVAEGGGLLNRYTGKTRIGGSNPPVSANVSAQLFIPILAEWAVLL